MRPLPPEEPEDPHRWVVSYADFITLLFAFFVVMYAISAVDARKLASVSESLRSAFVVAPAAGLPIAIEGIPAPGPRPARPPVADVRRLGGETPGGGIPLSTVRERVDEVLSGLGPPEELRDVVSTEMQERGLVISLAGNALFEPGSARLRPETRELLRSVGSVLAGVDADVRVEGHTDDRPVAGGPWETNWELSAARAAAVVRALVDELGLDPARLSLAGYGDTRPLAPNDTPEGRAKNRRVDIVVLSRTAAADEPPRERRRRALQRVLEGLGLADREPAPDAAADASGARAVRPQSR